MSKSLRFLASELPEQRASECLFHIIPVPYEASVSYGGGTAGGPNAIIEASEQLEVWTGQKDPSVCGIYTAEAVNCKGEPKTILERIGQAVESSLSSRPKGEVVPIILGGEHSITPGILSVLKKHFGTFGIVHFDAHADLRYSYHDSIYSHACPMRRACEMDLKLFQLGVRSLSPEEVTYRKVMNIGHLDARALFDLGERWSGDPQKGFLPDDFPENIFISFDVDALDPSIIPSTGTPEPGGLTWYQTLNLLEAACKNRKVIGADFVELAPKEGVNAPDFATARLIYEFMGIIAP
ncbi:agmatinase [Desulfovibrio litoralis]|uniref:Agmatinase n=1 Tax=Desulfovibrio litoralis DSM 11393 TaxID=1121455 RepID=A0A1M7TA53_9BACT|nr:agmatinase [Desulfovibrio litoralis]SHN67625.1 agmatinase [Desulfovibrio litoralis DSM 11393]